MIALGDFPVGFHLKLPIDTYGTTGASITASGLAVTDIEIYKDGSTTQRASDNGYSLLDTDGIDFDGSTGLQAIGIDLSDNSDSGFYAAGSQYWIHINAFTVDSQTVKLTYYFTIGLSLRPATAGRTLVVDSAGVAHANAKLWRDETIPATNVTGVPITDVEYALGEEFLPVDEAGPLDANIVSINDSNTGLNNFVRWFTTDGAFSLTGFNFTTDVTGDVIGNVTGSVNEVLTTVDANLIEINGDPDPVLGLEGAGNSYDADGGFALTTAERDSIAAAILDLADAVETSVTVRKVFRLLAALGGGKTSGGGAVYRNIGDSKNVVSSTLTSGDRTAVTLDLT